MINARHWQNCISGSQLSATPPLSPSLPVSLCHPHFKQISLAAKKLGFALSSSWGFLLSLSRVESRKDNRTFCLFSSLLSVLCSVCLHCPVLFRITSRRNLCVNKPWQNFMQISLAGLYKIIPGFGAYIHNREKRKIKELKFSLRKRLFTHCQCQLIALQRQPHSIPA